MVRHGGQEGVPGEDAVPGNGKRHGARFPDEFRVAGEMGRFGEEEGIGGYRRGSPHFKNKVGGGNRSGGKSKQEGGGQEVKKKAGPKGIPRFFLFSVHGGGYLLRPLAMRSSSSAV